MTNFSRAENGMNFTVAKSHARDIFREALEAVDPKRCVHEHIALEGNILTVESKQYDLVNYRSVSVISFGKAASAMSKALEEILADKITDGIVISNAKPPYSFSKMRFYQSSHPIPDERSLGAAREVLKILDGTDERDLVIFLISGGGSSLIAMPAQGISLEDKRKTTEMLLVSGVDTYGLNAVRKHISQIKGGGLLKKALPSQIITLVLSDVVGDKLDVIASSPTFPDSTTFEEAWKVIEALRLEHRLPPQVVIRLEEGRKGEIPETLKDGEFDPEKVQTVFVGNNFKALVAAQSKAESLGYNTLMLSSQTKGEAREVAKVIASVAFEIERLGIPVQKPACVIFGGETTVTVTGSGRGGRNTETALSFAMEIMGHNAVGLFCGTDGVDGPTDAAGAICDGETRQKARELGISAREHLARNDSYTFFERTGGLIKTGPTGTNVMDIGVVIVE